MSLMVREAKGEIEPCWQYNTDLFEAVTIERMAKHFLSSAIDSSKELQIYDLIDFLSNN